MPSTRLSMKTRYYHHHHHHHHHYHNYNHHQYQHHYPHHQDNVRVLGAVLCAGLSPNIIQVRFCCGYWLLSYGFWLWLWLFASAWRSIYGLCLVGLVGPVSVFDLVCSIGLVGFLGFFDLVPLLLTLVLWLFEFLVFNPSPSSPPGEAPRRGVS
jgi:hypothetical protein